MPKHPILAASFPGERISLQIGDFVTDKESLIGRGGFASVYLAYHREDVDKKYRFALKQVRKDRLFSARGDSRRTVMRERFALARMDHPFILFLQGSFSDEGHLYFLLDYMPNGTLRSWHKQYKVFRSDVIRFYTAELIVALDYLRTVNIVHCDLKPHNVLLDVNMHIKLCDFGLCRVVEDLYAGSRRQLWHANLEEFKLYDRKSGTPGYISPEVYKMDAITYSSDLWALGCMIYEFHTGQSAFGSSDYEEKCLKGIYRPFPDGSDANIVDAVSKLLVLDPTKRLGAEKLDHLAQHNFWGGESVENWELLHTATPPRFDQQPPGGREDYVLPLTNPQRQHPIDGSTGIAAVAPQGTARPVPAGPVGPYAASLFDSVSSEAYRIAEEQEARRNAEAEAASRLAANQQAMRAAANQRQQMRSAHVTALIPRHRPVQPRPRPPLDDSDEPTLTGDEKPAARKKNCTIQ